MSPHNTDPLTIYCPSCNEAFLGLPGKLLCPRCGMPIASPDITSLKTMLWHASENWSEHTPTITETKTENLESLVGTSIEKYELETLLGRGGMGWVFLARHLHLNRACALKILSPALVAQDPGYLDRFCTEGQAAASLVHPNIVTVHAIGQYEGKNYLEMEFVPGRSLQNLLREGPLLPLRVMSLGLRIANGLAAAHRVGVVHRDLKPDNVLLTHRGIPKIADFGLAKRIRGKTIQEKAGTLAGTPHFMAPELFAGAEATPSSDVYALGVCVYFMLTGQLPFAKRSISELINAVTYDRAPSIHSFRKDVPLELAECVSILLDKNPNNRPCDGIEATQLLNAVLGQSQDLETLLHEALDTEKSVKWCREGSRYRILVALPNGRRQTVFVETSEHQFHDRLLQIYSTCCPAQEHYHAEALRLNATIFHGAIALRVVDGVEYFVTLAAYPRGTADAEEIRRSVLEMAMHADAVESRLTDEDHN